MNRIALTALLPVLWSAPQVGHAAACMAGMVMPGCTPVPAAAPRRAVKPTPKTPPAKAQDPAPPARRGPACMAGMVMPGCAPEPASRAGDSPSAGADPHAGHDMSSMAGPTTAPAPAADPHAGHDMSAMPPAGAADHAAHDMPAAAEPAIPQTPPPPPPTDHLADRYFGPAAMAAARRQLAKEHGGAVVSKVMANLAEYQARSGRDGYRWDAEGWWGGDINRFVAKSEGEGAFGADLERAEVQALYSRAIGRYFDLQAGVRQDFKPGGRTYLAVGTEGLFPYWFAVEGAVFLSTTGELLARVEGTYDFRLTQRLVLQPRAELNFAAQDTRQTRTGSGLSDAELGLRLRYEIRREFAPYIGVSYERRFGRTARFARASGEDVRSVGFVAGVRAWF